MSRGFLIPVGDYRATKALVDSLHVAMPDANVTVAALARQRIPADVKEAADQIVRVAAPEWYNADCNVALMYDVSPYEETIVLSDDMVVPVDISYMWDLLEPYDLLFATNPLTYRGSRIFEDAARIGFVQNRLSDIHTAMTFFRKSDVAERVFTMATSLADHWKEYRKSRLQGDIGYHPTNDALFACAIKESGCIRETYPGNTEWFTIIDMVMKAQDVENATEMDPDWVAQINSYIKPDGSLIVGQYLQNFPFRYHQLDFLRPSTTNILARGASCKA